MTSPNGGGVADGAIGAPLSRSPNTTWATAGRLAHISDERLDEVLARAKDEHIRWGLIKLNTALDLMDAVTLLREQLAAITPTTGPAPTEGTTP